MQDWYVCTINSAKCLRKSPTVVEVISDVLYTFMVRTSNILKQQMVSNRLTSFQHYSLNSGAVKPEKSNSVGCQSHIHVVVTAILTCTVVDS